MKYNGGKSFVSPKLANVINQFRFSSYHEPFVGAASVITKVRGNQKSGSDIDVGIISLLCAVRDGWQPPTSVSEEEYHEAKKLDHTDPLYAFCRNGCSFGGKPWGGVARDRQGQRNFAQEARDNLLRMSPRLKGVELRVGQYQETPPCDLVYCDPPYAGTAAVGGGGAFDSDAFWAWCRERVAISTVLVTEYQAPDDWHQIWAATTNKGLGDSKKVERLFIHESQVRLFRQTYAYGFGLK